MNARMLALTLTLSMSALAPLALRDTAPLEASELRALTAASARDGEALEAQRAGLLEEPAAIACGERATLTSAADSALEELRAGDLHLTDREIKLMLIAAGVVLVVALLV